MSAGSGGSWYEFLDDLLTLEGRALDEGSDERVRFRDDEEDELVLVGSAFLLPVEALVELECLCADDEEEPLPEEW